MSLLTSLHRTSNTGASLPSERRDPKTAPEPWQQLPPECDQQTTPAICSSSHHAMLPTSTAPVRASPRENRAPGSDERARPALEHRIRLLLNRSWQEIPAASHQRTTLPRQGPLFHPTGLWGRASIHTVSLSGRGNRQRPFILLPAA